jgi:hypothetical protein
VRKIEQQYRLSHLGDVRQPIAALIREQYGVQATGERPVVGSGQ